MYPNPEESAFLVAQAGPLNGQRWAVNTILLIGRDSQCDIVIADRQVSRHHARLQFTPQGANIEDLMSKNGTFINGHVLHGSTLIQDGDTIQIALIQQFVYLSSDATVPLEIEEGGPAKLTASLPPSDSLLRLEKRSRRVWIGDEEVDPPLSVPQFRLLELLYENSGKVVSRQDLIATVWTEEQSMGISEQAFDALVRRLRDRLASIDPVHPYIVTVRGHGLRLDNPPVAPD